MAAYLPSYFNQQFFYNGAVAAGQVLYVYETGTSTPKTVYTDQAGTIPYTQPIVLDANGKPEDGPFWILSGECEIRQYTAVLPGGALVDTFTDVAGVATSADLSTLRADLASTSDPAKGAGMCWFDATLNYAARTIGAALRDGELNVLNWMSTAERADIMAGTGSLNVQPKLSAAATFAGIFGKCLFLPAGMYRSESTWIVPLKVGIRGESAGWPAATFDPANAWQFGPVIFKAHNGDGVTKTGTGYSAGAHIENLTVSSHRTNYPGGRGIVLDQTGSVDLIRCKAFGCAGDGIVVGLTGGDVTGHTRLERCYVNNCGGRAYQVRAKWCIVDACLSDGCTHGLYLQDAPETKIGGGCHFEGFSVCGVRFAGACTSSDFTGKVFIGDTAGAGRGIVADNVSGNSLLGLGYVKLQGPSNSTAITFTGALVAATVGTLVAAWAETTGSYGLYFSDGSIRTATLTNGSAAASWAGAVTATVNAKALSYPASIGIDLQGTAALGAVIDNAEINNWAIGVNDFGTSRTRILKTDFFQCGTPIVSNSTRTRYRDNVFDSTVGLYDIDHQGGGGGTWCDNDGANTYKTTSSGVAGDFGTNTVRDNKGFKTSASGVTAGLVASGVVIPHGLGIAPTRTDSTVLFGAYTNLIVSAVDATNLTITWDGGATLQIQWRAQLACETQT